MTMRSYIIYNSATGEIIRSGMCQTNMILKQPRDEGQSIMLGDLPNHLQTARRIKIINSKPCIVGKPSPGT
jgi:hypothetical protein